MATGYDNRQGGRSSFAFQPPAPVQGRSQRSGQVGRTGINGGETVGGVVNSTPQTTISSDSMSNIPAFLEKLAEPAIQARQQQKFFEGAAAAAQGQGIKEIADTQPAWANMFGPNHYVEGAGAYTALKVTSDWEREMSSPESLERLKKLSPEDVGKELSKATINMLTGSVATDNMIQANVVERTGPLMSLVTKERAQWQQQEVMRTQTAAMQSGSETFEQSARTFAKFENPGEEEAKSFQQARGNFLKNLVPPIGQTEDSYKTALYNNSMLMMQNGQFYSYEALKGSGALAMLGDDKVVSLERRYDSLSGIRMQEAATDRAEALLTLDTQVERGELSPIETANAYMKFNDQIRRDTGIVKPYFDINDIRAGAKSVTKEIIRVAEREEERATRRLERQADREAVEAAKDAAEARTAATAVTLVSAGQANAAVADGGITQKDLDTAMFNAYMGPDKDAGIHTLILNHQNGLYISSPVANAMKANVTSNIPAGFDAPSFQNSYKEWKAFELWPGGQAARAGYFAEHDRTFQAMDSLVRGGTPGLQAFAQTFGVGGIKADPASAADKKAVHKAVADFGPNLFEKTFGGRKELNASAVDIITNAVANGYKQRMAGSPGLSPELAAKAELTNLVNNGKLEVVGGFAWFNTTENSAKMTTLTGLTDRELSAAFDHSISQGFGTWKPSGDRYVVLRNQDASGRVVLTVTGYQDDGDHKTVVVHPEQLMAYNKSAVVEKRQLVKDKAELQQLYRSGNLGKTPDSPGQKRIKQLQHSISNNPSAGLADKFWDVGNLPN